MKKAIQFGAGNIGRGFIGAVLEQAGYHVVYADINQQIIDKINKEKAYPVHIMDTKCYDQKITNISGINSTSKELPQEIKDADIITTAVGLNILPDIAPQIAKGIQARKEYNNQAPLNIIACENGIRATSLLKIEIFKHLGQDDIEWTIKHIGFPDCSVDRIVPPIHQENTIDVVVENFFEWNVDKKSIVGQIPYIPGMNLVDNLMASIERKLFTLNTGHAITAYLGILKGYKSIDQSINDPQINNIVRKAMQESGLALIAKYELNKEEHFEYIEKIIDRFKNIYLQDDLTRVGREPIRKLSKNDRLIRPLLTACEYGIKADNLILGVAAALHYTNDTDKQSVEMQNNIRTKGVKATIAEIADIDKENIILDEIEIAYYGITNLLTNKLCVE